MTGLTMMLKAFGIQLTPEQIAMAEREIPALPQRIVQAGAMIQNGLQNFEQRLQRIESAQAAQQQLLEQILETLESNDVPIKRATASRKRLT